MNFQELKALPIEAKIEAINAMPSWACTLQIKCKAINEALHLMGSERRLGYAHGYQNLGLKNSSATSGYFWFFKGDDLYDHRNTQYFAPKTWQEALDFILSA